MSATPKWHRAIANALAKSNNSNFIQLATITSGRPAVRTVVVRDFIIPVSRPSRPLLLATTDIRMPKVAELVANMNVGCTWWISETREQFRIRGVAKIWKKTCLCSARKPPAKDNFNWENKAVEVFRNMSPGMKASWCLPTPGTPLDTHPDSPPDSWPTRIVDPEEGDKQNRENWNRSLSRFALLLIEPSGVDYVELAVAPNKRTKFWLQGGKWHDQACVP
ncbi:hypothetical protein FISHEDRAFT_64717 [Fistulina hepatica ATCC 64428]|uniref:Pyridoxamine 5'-phosphate oxidase Alr4036 family FMN-binding domain-containing protein n=1 Tax=Fistulina hepatica ATCC 64428 TaxID=1128425 RepID=A0A0D7AI36_9AGAR|nr:hypothetical protein FISHEDRAFT_64717 [Fistulina hepatica ATCC 64428]